jgi:peptidoglycan/xylan/chitin deacetylase (PgdA/CDA1 family)
VLTLRRKRRYAGWLAALAIMSVIPLGIYFEPRWLLNLIARKNPDVLFFVKTPEKVVALTIDDVPYPTVTPRILDVLGENGAHATFFVIGDHARGNAAILERIRREGHELGNHMNHEYPSVRLTPDEFQAELRMVDQVIQPTPVVKWFRPGSGWFNTRMLEQARHQGYRCALGSVYPFDTITRNERLIAWYVQSQIFPGAVIILHDGRADRIRTALVLQAVLPRLVQSGYKVVTLSELAARQSAR